MNKFHNIHHLEQTLISVFNKNITFNIQQVRSYQPYHLLVKASENKLSRQEKDKLFHDLQTNSYFRKAIPMQGIKYNFAPFLKTYWVNIKHYGIQEVFAPDATSIRTYYGANNVLKIIEIKNQEKLN